jgi:hypothetical protein
LFTATVWATTLKCSIDQGYLWYTGRVKVDMVVLYEHRCAMGHYFWLTQAQMNE